MKTLPKFALLTLTLAAAGCASSTNKTLDQKVAQSEVKNPADLQAKASKLIEADTSLTADQKQRLSALRDSISKEMNDISAQSLKLRSVLVDELLSPGYSIDEMAVIKKRIKKLEDKRLSLMFDGVDKANSILGRDAPKHSRIMRELVDLKNLERE